MHPIGGILDAPHCGIEVGLRLGRVKLINLAQSIAGMRCTSMGIVGITTEKPLGRP